MSRWNNGRGYVSKRRVLAFHAEWSRLTAHQPEQVAGFLADHGYAVTGEGYVVVEVIGDVAVPQGGAQ